MGERGHAPASRSSAVHNSAGKLAAFPTTLVIPDSLQLRSFKRRGPEEEPVLIAIFLRQQGDFFVRLKTRNRELMGNNSRTRLELFQLRKQTLQQRRRQVNRDHVRAAQIDRENVLVL